jgi:hypothetical protein
MGPPGPCIYCTEATFLPYKQKIREGAAVSVSGISLPFSSIPETAEETENLEKEEQA